MAATKGSILVTGANGGLGSAIAEHIAKKPELSTYHGLYTVRDAASAPALASALAHGGSSHPHEHDVISLDLTKLDNVRQVANHINGRVSAGQIPPIKALILAAGHQDFGKQTWTGDGFDTTFASNYLGHWLLTLMLLQSMDKTASRIVIIGSWSHKYAISTGSRRRENSHLPSLSLSLSLSLSRCGLTMGFSASHPFIIARCGFNAIDNNSPAIIHRTNEPANLRLVCSALIGSKPASTISDA
ncbi:hypothetical protein EKO27_g3952 [Xylaria grammica]|uniref:Ketoreductase (KR) domain-containing protein n=1 Tax=Xylaria grammica TaxID=363999 RepID=A0A439D9R6_9PEZI|nr:hypothetical protein EKO27_g3952 [Xylaria grammica]